MIRSIVRQNATEKKLVYNKKNRLPLRFWS